MSLNTINSNAAYIKLFKEDLNDLFYHCIQNQVQPIYLTTHITTYFEKYIQMGIIFDYKYIFPTGMTNQDQITIEAEVWFNSNSSSIGSDRFIVSAASNNLKDNNINSAYDRAMEII